MFSGVKKIAHGLTLQESMTVAENSPKKPTLIHVAKIRLCGRPHYLLLRQLAEERYVWFLEVQEREEATDIAATTAEEALRLARRHWSLHTYLTLGCGFRFSLPERDEHGINALFHQMAASYNTPNGVYFDLEVGHNCIVHAASSEARALYRRLQLEGRL